MSMGVNQDSSGSSSKILQPELPGKNVFRLVVVEHLSWNTYDETEKCFKPCDEKNKPIADREFKVKMPNGSIISMKTDANGVIKIECDGQTADTANFEVIFEPEEANLNNKYDLYYNKSAPVIKKL
jgi:hypothetical protein